MIKIVREDVNIDLGYLMGHIGGADSPNFNKPAGVEHYRLLAYISTLFNNKLLIDIGTRWGSSAVALSHNPTNKIISYDIKDAGRQFPPANVEYRIQNIINPEDIGDILDAVFILIDIDPHNGGLERHLIDCLSDREYKGILMLDDISSEWASLERMWNELPPEYDNIKYDVTDIGHMTGSHILDFSGELVIE